MTLPVEQVLPALAAALAGANGAVLVAPPGAGKTTLTPLALLDAPWLAGRRIVMLEPRRLAARAAAHRMAQLLGERVGGRVGYRVHLDSQVSARTRVEVVTEGVLTRMLVHDPTLEQVGLVIFDELHERSLHADLGLALTLQLRDLLRPELRLLAMSATLDTARVAELIGGEVLRSEGRTYPVETHYHPGRGRRIEAEVAALLRQVLDETDGDVLVFLPGAGEIRRTEALLADRPEKVLALAGSMTADEQDEAIRPARDGTRKVVLATAVAQTSLTIEGVRVVVDAGLARVPRFDPRSGLTRLRTVRVTRAAADQRRGRAGREAPGRCYRLWSEGEQASLLPHDTPEIREADLAPLVLTLASLGITQAADLRWLDPPPAAAWEQATELLLELDALGAGRAITPHGSALAALPAHPRLAHLLVRARELRRGASGAAIAALLGDRDILLGDGGPPPVDLELRLQALRADGRGRTGGAHADRRAVRRAAEEARALRARLGLERVRDAHDGDPAGWLLALAYPDRVAQRRPGPQPRYLLRNGTGAVMPDGDALGVEPYVVVADTDGARPEARIRMAGAIALAEIRELFAHQIVRAETVEWDDATRRVRSRRLEQLGALVLSEAAVPAPDRAAVREVMEGWIRRSGLDVLPWSPSAVALRQRMAFARRLDAGMPDVAESALMDGLDLWLGPALDGVASADQLARIELAAALGALLDWRQRAQLDLLAPTHLVVPTGSRLPVSYADPGAPVLAVRLQEMFGAETTPTVGNGRVPVTLHLLSPAGRPVQVTQDLAGFWRTSYFDVRKDLRGRYARHHWPEDPLAAEPTRRARRRGESRDA